MGRLPTRSTKTLSAVSLGYRHFFLWRGDFDVPAKPVENTTIYAGSRFWFVALFVAPGERACRASLSGRARVERSKSSNGPGEGAFSMSMTHCP
jgi:hypothetical protein